MKIYNLNIADKFVEVLGTYKIPFISSIDDFEEKINSKAPDMMEECYLLVKAMKVALYEMYMFADNIDMNELVDILTKDNEFSEVEAIFVIGIMKKVINRSGVQMSIVNFDDVKERAFLNHSLPQIKMLALAYFNGEGIDQDYEEAYKYFSYLYDQGDYSVLPYLGYMLENSLGVEEDIAKAVDCYERGALNHDYKCLYHLGICHLQGKGCIKDKEIAKKYLEQSQDLNAYKTLASIYEEEGKLKETFDYHLKAAHMYDTDSMYFVAMHYFEGKGVSKNINEALKYFVEAAYLNHKDALCQVGYMIIKGIGFDKDIPLGLDYIHKAAKLESYNAYILLAKFYEFGQYVEENKELSIYYYQKAIEIQENQMLNEKKDEK
jgi:TPR repeat protein